MYRNDGSVFAFLCQTLLMKWFLILCTILLACRQDKRPTTSSQEPATAPQVVTRMRENPDTPARKQPVEDNLIIPGERVGRVYLGMDDSLIAKLLGDPDSGNAAMGKAWMTWESGRDEHNNATQLEIFTTYSDNTMRQKTVQQIRTTSNKFRTPAGLSVYSSLSDLQRVHSGLKKVATYADDNRPLSLFDDKEQGIAYEVVAAGNQELCTAIIIYPKGKSVFSGYRLLYPELKEVPAPSKKGSKA